MQRTFFALALFPVLLACGGGSGPGGSADLNADECRQLLLKIEELTFADLNAEDRALAASTPQELAEDVQECVQEQAWNREGFECAMKATTESALKRCILTM